MSSSSDSQCNCEGFLITLAVIFGIFTFTFIFTLAAFSSPPITMQPVSFSISNFSYNWEADFIFECKTCMSSTKIYYSGMGVSLSYQKIDGEFSEASIDPFRLKGNEKKIVRVHYGSSNQSVARDEIVVQGKKEVANMIHMNMTLDLDVHYKIWGFFWGVKMNGPYESFCWDLFFAVEPETGGGRLIASTRTPCHERYP
ncbi:hypothetical protein COLO4_32397 [Corchorus olitorius]|uniref:Late embryogenesis abundant protein, LEA-14 n=1 Tax=Corchorus olitorius TaxID=93759 RepID=A0A1R3GZD9_9ROSI|nr:hypothetical protein COLO4_32397 [Corchorus olitorius]